MRTKYLNNTFRGSLKNPFQSGLQVGTRYIETFQFEPAVVVDVITNDSHPEYSEDGYNVGTIRFRFLHSQENRPEESLNVAFPIDANCTCYPLLNELVLVFPSLNRFYYTNIFNTSNRPTAQPIFGIKEDTDELESDQARNKNYDENASGGAPQADEETESDTLGDRFVDKDDVFRLRAQEGDIIYEGRSGNSIRLGSNLDRNQSPNILIRVGPNPTPDKSREDSPFALVDENIDRDLSSIWMVSNQTVPLTLATVNDETHFRSLGQRPSSLDGNQIVVNTDRIVLNTKQDKLLVSSFLGTHFSTLQDHTVDAAKNYKSFVGVNREVEAGQDYLITTGRNHRITVGGELLINVSGKTEHTSKQTHSIVGRKIFIGSLSDESEPQVLGEQLRLILLELVDAHLNNAASHVLPTIGIGPLAPGTVAALQRVRSKLLQTKSAPFESITNFVSKTNSTQ